MCGIQGISQEEKEKMEQLLKKLKLAMQNLNFNKSNEEIIAVLLTLLEDLSLIIEKQQVIIDDLELMQSTAEILIHNREITIDSKQDIIDSLVVHINDMQNDRQKTTKSILTEAKKEYQELIATCNEVLIKVLRKGNESSQATYIE